MDGNGHGIGKACVTGACRGLGLAFAEHFARLGYDLILIDKNSRSLELVGARLRDECDVAVQAFCVDLCNREDLNSVCERLVETEGLIVLVNNAGFGLPGQFAETDPGALGAMVDLHVQCSVALCRAVLPRMLSQGAGNIINVASLGGFRPGPGDIVYGATKRFLIHFSRSLQKETAGSGVNIQALCPGFVRTEFHDAPAYEKHGAPKVPGFFWMGAGDVASSSISALTARKVVHIPGFRSYLLLFFAYNPLLWRIVCGVNRRLTKIRGKSQLRNC